MAESTGVDEARTLHSALGLGTGEEVGDGERVRFVDADLVIVDEFSMVDMWLAQQFFKRIGQHTRVVLVGDPNQLPSVGAGNVFYELIHSGMVPVTVLDWIFRQSKDGLIAYNAKFINEGSTKLYYGNFCPIRDFLHLHPHFCRRGQYPRTAHRLSAQAQTLRVQSHGQALCAADG